MESLVKIKDQVAQRMGFCNWKRFISFVNPTDDIVDEVARLYANDKLDQASIFAQTKLKSEPYEGWQVIIDKQSILNLKDKVSYDSRK